MTDPKLKEMVQGLIDAGKPEAEILSAIRSYQPAPTEPERPPFDAEAEGMMELGKHPGINATAAGVGLGAMLPGGMLKTAANYGFKGLNALAGGYTGATQGYKLAGIPGAITGGIGGATAAWAGPELIKGGLGYIKAATAAKNAEAAAAAAKAAPSIVQAAAPGMGNMLGRMSASGADVAQAEAAALRNQLMHMLKAVR